MFQNIVAQCIIGLLPADDREGPSSQMFLLQRKGGMHLERTLLVSVKFASINKISPRWSSGQVRKSEMRVRVRCHQACFKRIVCDIIKLLVLEMKWNDVMTALQAIVIV